MEQISSEVHTYEEEFPRHLGPPPVPNNTGKKLHNQTKPVYAVELDAGAFLAVWEHMEAEARHRFPTRGTMPYVGAYLRAVEAFRDTWWATHDPDAPPAPPPAGRRIRRGR
jgi:hypothetical protein